MREAIAKAVKTESIKAKLVALGLDVPVMDEARQTQFAVSELEKWSELVRMSGAHID